MIGQCVAVIDTGMSGLGYPMSVGEQVRSLMEGGDFCEGSRRDSNTISFAFDDGREYTLRSEDLVLEVVDIFD